MPIYEYQCSACGERLELLVLGTERPRCSSCGSLELERLVSLPSVSSDSSRSRARADVKKRRGEVRQEQNAAELQAMRDHKKDHH